MPKRVFNEGQRMRRLGNVDDETVCKCTELIRTNVRV
jgi:hypothetical protein